MRVCIWAPSTPPNALYYTASHTISCSPSAGLPQWHDRQHRSSAKLASPRPGGRCSSGGRRTGAAVTKRKPRRVILPTVGQKCSNPNPGFGLLHWGHASGRACWQCIHRGLQNMAQYCYTQHHREAASCCSQSMDAVVVCFWFEILAYCIDHTFSWYTLCG